MKPTKTFKYKLYNISYIHNKEVIKMYGECKSYGQKGLINRLRAIIGKLNRKGYVCHRMMAQGIQKDLKKRGMLI